MAARVMPGAGLDPATAVIPVDCSNGIANRARRIALVPATNYYTTYNSIVISIVA